MPEIIVRQSGYISMQSFVDGFDGILSIAEAHKHIPFDIKRVYYIHNLIKHEHVVRGKHAHKRLQQALFCINGSCDITLDDGVQQQVIHLEHQDTGIYLGPKLWHTMSNFNNNCILLVLASDWYDEADYIREYGQFLAYVRGEDV